MLPSILTFQTVPGGPNLLKGAGFGTVRFVNSGGGGSTTSGGLTPETAFTTLDSAINASAANDTIILMPGHSETIAGADGFDADVAGLTIIGLGENGQRPTFTFSATASACAIGANNVVIENVRFSAGVSAVVAPLTIEGKTGVVIRNCEFYWGGTTGWDFVDSIVLSAASNRCVIEGCRFLAEPAVAGAATAVKLSGASHNVKIQNNEFMGDYSTACVNGITTLSQGLMFLSNYVHNTDASEPYLEVLTGTTGIIANTRGLASGATVAANAVADAMAHCENFVVNTAGTIAIVKGAGGSPALDAD